MLSDIMKNALMYNINRSSYNNFLIPRILKLSFEFGIHRRTTSCLRSTINTLLVLLTILSKRYYYYHSHSKDNPTQAWKTSHTARNWKSRHSESGSLPLESMFCTSDSQTTQPASKSPVKHTWLGPVLWVPNSAGLRWDPGSACLNPPPVMLLWLCASHFENHSSVHLLECRNAI